MKKLYLKTAAAITAGAYMFQANEAAAGGGTGFREIVSNIRDSVSTIPQLLATLCYLAGIAFVVAGIFKLKKHVESPGNEPLQNAVIRLGVGGALLVAPVVVQAATSSIGAPSGTIGKPTFGPL